MRILVLEDSRYRIEKFTENFSEHTVQITTTAEECIEELRWIDWDLLLLDHDLGGESLCDTRSSNTGSEVVRYIVKQTSLYNLPIIIHSMNAPAAIRMEQDLTTVLPFVYRIPWLTLCTQLQGILDTVSEYHERQKS